MKTLINILTEPKNALVKQYQKFFRMEGCELEFTTGALELIAKRALKRDTGARALRAVCEEIMLDLMYKLPDHGQGGKFVIDEASSTAARALFELKPEPRRQIGIGLAFQWQGCPPTGLQYRNATTPEDIIPGVDAFAV